MKIQNKSLLSNDYVDQRVVLVACLRKVKTPFRRSLTHLLQILKFLEIVFLFQPAFNPEVCQDLHHLSDWDPRQ